MHFSVAVAAVQSQVGTIKGIVSILRITSCNMYSIFIAIAGVEISYSDKDPLAYDLIITLTQDGIR